MWVIALTIGFSLGWLACMAFIRSSWTLTPKMMSEEEANAFMNSDH